MPFELVIVKDRITGGDTLTVHGDKVVSGNAPVVIIGPNGAGKSRLAFGVARTKVYGFIPAERVTTIPVEVNALGEDQAKDAFRSVSGPAGPREPARTARDVDQLFQLLKAEEQQAWTAYGRAQQAGQAPVLPRPNLTLVEELWRLVFPDRRFDMTTHRPMVQWVHGRRSGDAYSASSMSDGEKSVLYLAARLIVADPGIVIVDEPETHLHSLLARRFWDAVETIRPDCRFVYATHDLQFALSRPAARICIVQSEDEITVLPENAVIPGDLFAEILGAASLSVVADRIAFCEGRDDGSLDRRLYEAWFSKDTAVVPVGSCTAVRRSVEVFTQNKAISNATALGIVERDFWPDDWLAARAAEGFFVLDVHELESLFCLKAIAKAVARHQRLNDFEGAWADMEARVRGRVVAETYIVERAKRRIDIALTGLANAARGNPDRATARTNFIASIDIARKVPDIGAVFDEEAQIVDGALSGDWDGFLRIIDGKKIIGEVAQVLCLTRDRYAELVIAMLSDPPEAGSLAAELAAALSSHLPQR